MKKLFIPAFALIVLTGCVRLQAPITLDSLYEQWKSLDNVSYRVRVVESQGNQLVGFPDTRIHVKDRSKIRLEIEGEGSVFITNPDRSINALYYPARNAYVDLAFVKGDAAPTQYDQLTELYDLLRDKFTIVGDEKVNGYDAVIVEGLVEDQLQRLWISTKYALPVKMQSYDENGELLAGVEFLDISTDSLSDQLFELPSTAEEISITDFFDSLQ